MDKKLESKLRKLLALAERGIGGEKDNAQRMLHKMLDKNGLTLADISGDHTEIHWFKHHQGKINSRLMHQVIYSVCGERDTWSNKRRRYQIGAYCSEFERLQIEIKYSLYKPELDQELELAYDAFLQVNKVFPENSSSEDSEIDIEYLEKLWARTQGMNPVPVHDALPEKTKQQR